MDSKLQIKEFLAKSAKIPIVDVRSPAEYSHAHIPGAYSMPLFNNEERSEVGTLYKKEGKEVAFLRGLDIVGPKMSWFVSRAKEIAVDNELLLYCWRGGMRSGSLAWLFNTAWLKAQTLEGGYKAYRHYIRQAFLETQRLIVVGGMTGSGKTDILAELHKLGEQVLDLEALANHKGSAFGGIGQKEQPTNEWFENIVAHQWLEFDMQKPIWTEDESFRIGKVTVPETLYQKMRETTVIKLEVPFELRVKRLVKEYAGLGDDYLKQAIQRISKRLGGLQTQQALEALENKDYTQVAGIALRYYDKTYMHGLSRRNAETIVPFPVNEDNPPETARKLKSFIYRNEAKAG